MGRLKLAVKFKGRWRLSRLRAVCWTDCGILLDGVCPWSLLAKLGRRFIPFCL